MMVVIDASSCPVWLNADGGVMGAAVTAGDMVHAGAVGSFG
jgi:hypothetical protein